MKYEYICAGNVMLDAKHMAMNEVGTEEFIGGPATFAYTGVRIWTDKVFQVSRVGKDYEPVFEKWMKDNAIEKKGFKVVCERSNHAYRFFHAYGWGEVPKWTRDTLDGWQDFGYMKIRPEDIGAFTKEGGIKGVYLAQNVDSVFWEQLGAIKKRDGFKIMFEIESVWCEAQYLDMVRNAVRYADLFSINLEETQKLFGCQSDEDCIAGLRTLPVDITLFRVGERGLYVVTKEEAIYLPPAPGPEVDPVGCGNTSTGAALYAFCEGKDPLMIGIMANVAAAKNIAQFGTIPNLEISDECTRMAEELYEKYR